MGACCDVFYRCGCCPGCADCYDPVLDAQTQTADYALPSEKVRAKIVEVHDGDTVRAKFRVNGVIQQHVVRLYGIDAPELNPKKAGRSSESIATEKQAAIKARDALIGRIGDRTVSLQILTTDEKTGKPIKEKFGRVLGIIRLRNGMHESVNDWMLNENHAVPYFGGKKGVDDQKPTKSRTKKVKGVRASPSPP